MDMNRFKTLEVKSRAALLCYRIILGFALFGMLRLVYYAYNYSYFSHLSSGELARVVWGGMLFDGAALAFTNSLHWVLLLLGAYIPLKWERSRVYSGLLDLTFFVPNVVNLFVNISDAGYYSFVLRRTTASVFSEFGDDNLFQLFVRFVGDYPILTVSFIVILVLLAFGYYLVRRSPKPYLSQKEGVMIGALTLLELALLTLLSLFWIRGDLGLKTVPMTAIRANNYVKEYKDAALVLNTTFTIAKTLDQKSLEPYAFFTDEELKATFSSLYKARPLAENDSLFGSLKGKNVVVLILESFAREYSGRYNGGEGYTPFLDSLALESFAVRYGYANGRQSVDALPSAFASVPSLGLDIIHSGYSSLGFRALPEILENEGYSTAFYHGADRNSLGLVSFAGKIGIEDYFSKDEYPEPEHDDGAWGIPDSFFLPYAARRIGQQKRPFFAGLFTLSSHDPFIIPKPYEGLFPKGDHPMHEAVGYADYALRLFFEEAKKEGWYDETVFVLMGDHASVSTRPEYREATQGAFAINLLIHDPSGTLPRGTEAQLIGQQADILPTLLYLLGDDTEIVTYGHNLLDPEAEHFALAELNGVFYLFHRDVTVSLTGDGTVKCETPIPLFQGEKDSEEADPKDEEGLCDRYGNLLKAIVQDYTDRVLHDGFRKR